MKQDDKNKFNNKLVRRCLTYLLTKVLIEDIEFDKKYDIYSENQIEARYMLTPTFLELFKNMYTSFGTKKVKCSFYKNNLMIAISTKKNLFEIGNLYKNLINKKQIEKFMDEFTSILAMIEYFKLYEKTNL